MSWFSCQVLIQLYSLPFCIPVDLLKQRTVRFDGHRATKEHQMRKVKAKAQETVAAMQNQHTAELQREQSKNYNQERESSKKIVQLEGQLKSVESDASKQALYAQAEHERELESQKRIAEQDMKAAKAIHKSELKSQQSNHYREARNLTKAVACRKHVFSYVRLRLIRDPESRIDVR